MIHGTTAEHYIMSLPCVSKMMTSSIPLSSLSTQNDSTALLVSSLNGHSEVVKLLLQAGARDLPGWVKLYQNTTLPTYLHSLETLSPELR